ncbi:MAG: hypothetical protein RLZZ589_1687, partial [Cyanobacteriota bacterium]
MVLPEGLLLAMKQRAQQQGLTLTAYVSALVRADLGERWDRRINNDRLATLRVAEEHDVRAQWSDGKDDRLGAHRERRSLSNWAAGLTARGSRWARRVTPSAAVSSMILL